MPTVVEPLKIVFYYLIVYYIYSFKNKVTQYMGDLLNRIDSPQRIALPPQNFIWQHHIPCIYGISAAPPYSILTDQLLEHVNHLI